MTTVITFGTFDVLHIGHVRIMERARSFGDRLVVGISSDELNFAKKGRKTVYPQAERLEIVGALRYVDKVFVEESLELKEQYVREFNADVLVMGADWEGKFDNLSHCCRVVYLPRTAGISTTELIQEIKKYE